MLSKTCKNCECLGKSCDGVQENAWSGCFYYKKKSFELFGCRLGNGTTVCNKAVMENGDYKKIAHISDGGRIKWYVKNPESYVPADNMKTIQEWADAANKEFMEYWNRLPDLNKYEKMLDTVPYTVWLCCPLKEQLKNCTDLHEKVLLLEKIYFENYI